MNAGSDSAARARAIRVWSARRKAELEASLRFEHLAIRLSEQAASAMVTGMAAEAARDEMRHADRCAELAVHFGGAPSATPAVPKLRRVAPRELAPPEALLYEIVALCCVTETLSTALLGALVEAARDSFAKETMREILRDEVRHSRLGWAFLAEAQARPGRDVIGPHLAGMIEATLGSELFDSQPSDPTASLLAGLGELERRARERIARECFEHVIFPGLEQFGIEVSRGRQWLSLAGQR